MRRIFKKEEHQNQFDKNGYVLVKEAINQNELSILRKFYNEKFSKGKSVLNEFAVDLSITSSDIEFRKQSVNFICNHLDKIQRNILIDYEQLQSGSFIVKYPDIKPLGLHPHPIFVDIKKFKALILWIALDDTHKENGALQFIPNSFHQYDFKVTDEDKIEMENNSLLIKMKKGDAVIFDSTIKHWSDVNRTDKERLAVITEVKPKEAKLLFHSVRSSREGVYVDQYLVENNFTLNSENHAEIINNLEPFHSFLWIENQKRSFVESLSLLVKKTMNRLK